MATFEKTIHNKQKGAIMRPLYIKHILFLILLFVIPFIHVSCQSAQNTPDDFLLKKPEITWADSVFNQMTLDEKIAQLMIVRVNYNEKGNDQTYVDFIQQNQFGGVCFFKGTPTRQLLLTNAIQLVSKIPLMVTIDGEWGLSMRLDSTLQFPRQIVLGAIQNNDLIYRMGKEFARQFRRMGIHVNFAPVIDVNNNSKNPVINSRSFGENPIWVAQKGLAYSKGMEDNGLMACVKHFPGHGDTDSDSHYSLPVIKHSRKRLDQIELFPFKYLFKEGVSSAMIGHLFVPALDSTANLASSLSPKIVRDLLRNELKYDGLVFTDGLEMKGVTAFHKPGDLELRALLADNDLLLLPPNPLVALNKIKEAVENGSVPVELIDQKCLKILKAKEKWRIHEQKIMPVENLISELNSEYARNLLQEITDASISLIANKEQVIPLDVSKYKSIGVLSIGQNRTAEFHQQLSYASRISSYEISNSPKSSEITIMNQALRQHDLVIVALFGMNERPNQQYGLQKQVLQLLDSLGKLDNTVLAVFGNPYAVDYIKNIEDFNSVLIAYNSLDNTQKSVARGIVGINKINGQLPVSINEKFPSGTGLETKKRKTHPITEVSLLEHKIDEKNFEKMDSFVNVCIQDKIFPGCQIAVVYKGDLIYHKAYGNLDYEQEISTESTHLYDLASLTKVLASTLAVMKLYENNQVDLNKPISDYLPQFKNTAIENVTITQIMTHTAGFKAWIPFYRDYIKPEFATFFFSKTQDSIYSVKITDNLFTKPATKDSIYSAIANALLNKSNKYLYSDFGFIMMPLLVEKLSQMPFEDYLETFFYRPLGLNALGFNPLNKFSDAQIAPTELDKDFRFSLIRGTVHDQAAALMGGISGHAGLFSNAHDVAVIMQMLLNGGTYNGRRYLKESTIKQFTVRTPINASNHRRGLGFDKPVGDKNGKGPTSHLASSKTFGHTGFTGTCAWADPENNLVFVFLSNRVHPDAENKGISQRNVRTEIQSLIYEAISKK
ncbi:MAG: glycoside hydrolase family 3 N-terminal domain-containing protein [Bacteroidales bacterium]|nr:glycoside hydrolase family 3 N-terminal domain-containing protein [Bacteroidales bacterium]